MVQVVVTLVRHRQTQLSETQSNASLHRAARSGTEFGAEQTAA